MADIRNIHNNVIKLQVVSRKTPTANDLQYKDSTRKAMDSAQNSISLLMFLRELINEYGDYANDFKVKVSELSAEDKKNFLSNIVDAWDYEEYCSSPTLLQAAIIDKQESMQDMLDESAFDARSQYLYAMGYSLDNEYGSER